MHADPSEYERLVLELDAIDNEILGLLERRALLSSRFKALGPAEDRPHMIQKREQHTFEQVRARATAAMPKEAILATFREILSGCRAVESELRVVYLGPEAGFGELAVVQKFGHAATRTAAESATEVFSEVERDRADFGVVPLESSTDGIVHHTLDLLVGTSLSITGEIETSHGLHLLSKTGNVADIDKVYGFAAHLAACRKVLEDDFGKVSHIEVRSVNVAAQLVVEDHGAAAIGTNLVAERFGLEIVKSGIADLPDAQTRFVVVGRSIPRPTGQDRTTLLLSTKDGPGALFEAIRPFADRGINLTKIESRPARTNLWDYVFFIDVDGHITDRSLTSAVEEVKRSARFLKVLGSYPKK